MLSTDVLKKLPPPPLLVNKNTAGSRVYEMFQRRAVTTLANDIVVEVGLRLLAVSATVVYVLVTGVMMFGAFMRVGGADFFEDDGTNGDHKEPKVDTIEFWSVVGPQIFGVVALVFLISTVLEVVRSGFKAVFVCFVQVRRGWIPSGVELRLL